MGTYPLRPSTKQSGLKAPANTTFTEYMDTAAEVMDTAAKQDAVPSRETSHSVLHDPFPDLSAARSPKSTKNAARSPKTAD